MKHRYDFKISALHFRLESPKELTIPDEFQPFMIRINPNMEPDVLITVAFKTMVINPGDEIEEIAPSILRHGEELFFKTLWKNGEYIIRRELVGRENLCQLFIPESFTEDFCRQGKWLNYLSLERMLLCHNRLLLHASAVIYKGKTYIFSAPSGTGKSTHASLWQKYYNAKILNGDKVIIEVTDQGAMAHGGPVAGSSGIYHNDLAPIAAIIMLKQGKSNHFVPIRERMAFLSLYSEAIKSKWDTEFNCHLLDLLKILQNKVPVYSLECLPDPSAVECILQNMRG